MGTHLKPLQSRSGYPPGGRTKCKLPIFGVSDWLPIVLAVDCGFCAWFLAVIIYDAGGAASLASMDLTCSG